MEFKFFFTTGIFIFFFFVVLARTSYAYIDPGIGSYILQVLLAVIIGGLFAIKIFWSKIIKFFKKLFSKKQKS
jgi:hypothetical protein